MIRSWLEGGPGAASSSEAAAIRIRELVAPTSTKLVDVLGRDGIGRPPPARARSSRRGVPTRHRGIVFRSFLEAETLARLWGEADAFPGTVVLRAPRFDLWASWAEGMGRPLTFTPDAMVVRPRAPTSGASERLALLEVHEAKTPRGLESRDYAPRLAAFRAAYPWIPVFVWRREGKRGARELVRERLADLAG